MASRDYEYRSARGTSTVALLEPTAVQVDIDVQDTPLNSLELTPSGVGVGWMVQLDPVQCSANGVEGPTMCGEGLVADPPTAVQAEAEAHDTELRELKALPGGLGEGWIVQLVPFQRSTRVVDAVAVLLYVAPTAMQAVAEVHNTPLNKASVGLGVVWIDQLVPFQRSTNVPRVVRLDHPPTAVHAVAELHDTLSSSLFVAPAGAGVDRMDQVVPFQASTTAARLLL